MLACLAQEFVQPSELLDANAALIARYDPRDPALVFADSAGTVPVSSASDPVRRLHSAAAPAVFPLTAANLVQAPRWNNGALSHDGLDDRLVGAFRPGIPARLDVLMAFKSTDTGAALLSDLSANQFLGVMTTGSSSTLINYQAGSSQILIDGDKFSGSRAALQAALCDGTRHLVEVRGMDITGWTGLAFGCIQYNASGANSQYLTAGSVVPLVVLGANHADIDEARRAARRYAQYVIARLPA